MKQSFVRLDIFRKLPKDLTEPTFCGALVSFACTIILAILCLTELNKYMSVETKSDMLVDISHNDDRLNINVDFMFKRIPCDILSLDVQDIMGTHVVDIAGSLFKKKISKDGAILSQTSMLDNIYNRMDLLNRVRDELNEEQGCQLKGYFQINRVPGNFHISSHAFGDLIIALSMEGYSFDFSYQINHLSFGKDEDFRLIQRKFPTQGIMNPLDSLSQDAVIDSNKRPQNLEVNFYLIAVPSYFKDTRGNNFQVYQLTSNYITNFQSHQSILKFSYELSPISVQFYQVSENIFELVVYICAIVGGIFTVSGIIDAMIHKSVSAIFKQRIGKLS